MRDVSTVGKRSRSLKERNRKTFQKTEAGTSQPKWPTSATKSARTRHYAGGQGAGHHTQALCCVTLPAVWVIMYAPITDIEIVRELPTGRAEVLFFNGNAYAVGWHRTRT